MEAALACTYDDFSPASGGLSSPADASPPSLDDDDDDDDVFQGCTHVQARFHPGGAGLDGPMICSACLDKITASITSMRLDCHEAYNGPGDQRSHVPAPSSGDNPMDLDSDAEPCFASHSSVNPRSEHYAHIDHHSPVPTPPIHGQQMGAHVPNAHARIDETQGQDDPSLAFDGTIVQELTAAEDTQLLEELQGTDVEATILAMRASTTAVDSQGASKVSPVKREPDDAQPAASNNISGGFFFAGNSELGEGNACPSLDSVKTEQPDGGFITADPEIKKEPEEPRLPPVNAIFPPLPQIRRQPQSVQRARRGPRRSEWVTDTPRPRAATKLKSSRRSNRRAKTGRKTGKARPVSSNARQCSRQHGSIEQLLRDHERFRVQLQLEDHVRLGFNDEKKAEVIVNRDYGTPTSPSGKANHKQGFHPGMEQAFMLLIRDCTEDQFMRYKQSTNGKKPPPITYIWNTFVEPFQLDFAIGGVRKKNGGDYLEVKVIYKGLLEERQKLPRGRYVQGPKGKLVVDLSHIRGGRRYEFELNFYGANQLKKKTSYWAVGSLGLYTTS